MTLFIAACVVALPLWLIVAALRDIAGELFRIAGPRDTARAMLRMGIVKYPEE